MFEYMKTIFLPSNQNMINHWLDPASGVAYMFQITKLWEVTDKFLTMSTCWFPICCICKTDRFQSEFQPKLWRLPISDDFAILFIGVFLLLVLLWPTFGCHKWFVGWKRWRSDAVIGWRFKEKWVSVELVS